MQRGQAAVQTKNFQESVEWFTKASEESPKDPQIRACLGQSLCWLGRRDEGLVHLRLAGQLLLKKARKSRDVNLVLELTDQLQHWNDYTGALALCKQAVRLNPKVVRGYQFLALTYMRLNQNKSALSAARQAVTLAPDNAMLAILLATIEIAGDLPEQAVRRLEKVLQNPLLKSEEKFRAHKELARVLDKLREYERVFEHLKAAAEVAPQLPEVQRQDANLVPKMLAAGKEEFSAELLGRWADTVFPANQPAPVFVLGFMRTGTTLTQEVLGAHPKVFVADETDLIASVVKELNRLFGEQGSVAAQLGKLDLDGILKLREFYWQRARALLGDQLGNKLFLDKTTMNSIDLGLINCIFPDAKLIFLLRDPRDVCLSCIMQTMIPTPSTVQLLSWEGTARFYAQIMNWWQTIKPKLSMDFIELRYEDAVFRFEPTFRKVFDFLELDWDPVVAGFHNNAAGKFIASPSYSQVAQPLYSSSVGRWKHYESEYTAVSEWLQPFIDSYGFDSL